MDNSPAGDGPRLSPGNNSAKSTDNGFPFLFFVPSCLCVRFFFFAPSRFCVKRVLPHQRRGNILGGINPDHRRLRRQRAHFDDEGARRGQRKMGTDRIDALPLLDEDEAVGLLDIDMAAMLQTPGLTARPRAMFGAERDHALAMLGGKDDVAGDEDHYYLATIKDRRLPAHR